MGSAALLLFALLPVRKLTRVCNSEYALWLSGENISGSGGYANLTNWFVVESQYEDLK